MIYAIGKRLEMLIQETAFPLLDLDELPTIDPLIYPVALSICVRTVPTTNHRLTAICDAVGLIFWGEVIGLMMDYFAHNPAAVDLSRVHRAPTMIRERGRTFAGDKVVSRNILTPLTPVALQWLRKLARQKSLPLQTLAAVILHQNLEKGTLAIMARRGLQL